MIVMDKSSLWISQISLGSAFDTRHTTCIDIYRVSLDLNRFVPFMLGEGEWHTSLSKVVLACPTAVALEILALALAIRFLHISNKQILILQLQVLGNHKPNKI
jgi:hypothetical protein